MLALVRKVKSRVILITDTMLRYWEVKMWFSKRSASLKIPHTVKIFDRLLEKKSRKFCTMAFSQT